MINQKDKGTSATAVTRCIHQCEVPVFAEPNPTALAKGDLYFINNP
jgi:hypothetical protein